MLQRHLRHPRGSARAFQKLGESRHFVGRLETGSSQTGPGSAMKPSASIVHGDVTRIVLDLEETGEQQCSGISKKIPESSLTRLVDKLDFKFRHAIELNHQR